MTKLEVLLMQLEILNNTIDYHDEQAIELKKVRMELQKEIAIETRVAK